jgi:hypothetical protein
MRVRSLTAAFVLVFMASGPRAAEMEAPFVKAGGAHLTVYTNDFASVRDKRESRLSATPSDPAFTGVSGRVQPEAVLLKTLTGKTLTISEQPSVLM